MKIAIIGSGISGLSTAFYLSKFSDITIFEKNKMFGGHANTYDFNFENKKISIDCGFIVYNKKNYPNFIKILDYLNTTSDISDMSFAMSVDKRFEYSGSLIGMLGNYKNLLDKNYHKMIYDIFRFFKLSPKYLKKVNEDCTLDEFLSKFNFSNHFNKYHIIPMASAIWSSPEKEILKFPVKSLFDFYNNHQLLNFVERPQWRTIKGGSRNYVDSLISYLKLNKNNSFKLETEIVSIKKNKLKQIVIDKKNKKYEFDYVILTCHTDQSSKIIKSIDKNVSTLLNKFRYQNNLAYLHFDQSLMPKNKLIWSSWNYSTNSQKQISCITYWMNKLQNLDIDKNIFVTLNPIQIPKENKIIKIFKYEHPIYDQNSILVQKQIKSYQGKNKIFFAGAWNGYGFHEDGVKSALNIAKKLKVDLNWLDKNEKTS